MINQAEIGSVQMSVIVVLMFSVLYNSASGISIQFDIYRSSYFINEQRDL